MEGEEYPPICYTSDIFLHSSSPTLAFTTFLEALGEAREIPLNLKELKNEFKLPNKNFPKLSKMVHYFRTEFVTYVHVVGCKLTVGLIVGQ